MKGPAESARSHPDANDAKARKSNKKHAITTNVTVVPNSRRELNGFGDSISWQGDMGLNVSLE